MGDFFNLETGISVIASSTTPSALATSYNSTNSGIINMAKARYVALGVNYTQGALGSGNSIQLKFEVSNDQTTWYRLQTQSPVSGTNTRSNREDTFVAVAAAASYDRFAVDLENLAWRYLKVSAKETINAGAAGSFWIEASTWGR